MRLVLIELRTTFSHQAAILRPGNDHLLPPFTQPNSDLSFLLLCHNHPLHRPNPNNNLLLPPINPQPQQIRPAIVSHNIQEPPRRHRPPQIQISNHNPLIHPRPIPNRRRQPPPIRPNNTTMPPSRLTTHNPLLRLQPLNTPPITHPSDMQHMRGTLNRIRL